MKKLIACTLLLSSSSCHDKRPPSPTTEQSAQLNDAEDMLNNMARNEEGPEQSPGPSNSAK